MKIRNHVILDLQVYLAQTDMADLQRVYDNLMRGSRNHPRAFVSSLERQGVAYQPQYLGLEAYAGIVGAETERGGEQTGRGTLEGANPLGGRGARGRRGGRSTN
jgi:hypothetical protein